MTITIDFTGRYHHDDWIANEIIAVDDETDQCVTLTRDTDDTWNCESKLTGDDEVEFAGGLDFDTVWRSLATHFGIAP